MMIDKMHALPSLADRIAEGRPVLSREQASALCKRVLGMASKNIASVWVGHTARVISRMANDQMLSGDDGDEVYIGMHSKFGVVGANVEVRTNQFDDATLRAVVDRWETLALTYIGLSDDPKLEPKQVQDTFVPVTLWHDETVQAMKTTRGTVIPDVLSTVKQAGFRAAGFLGLMARSEAMLSQDGIFAYNEETDSELTVTARGRDDQSSGWAGQPARNWSHVRPAEVVARAIDFARHSANPVAIEPGRRTAILGPEAVVQIIRLMYEQYDAERTDHGFSGFSDPVRKNRLGQRVFDPRVSLNSDPNDPEGGYRPYFADGLATPAMRWVEQGVLKNLAYGLSYAMARGKPYADLPQSVRMSGGTTTIDEMIAQCKEGIYVNRFSSVELADWKTGLMTGVTRDGCLLIKNGKIDRAVKNFRFLESPFFILNSIEAIGVPKRAAFGFSPSSGDRSFDWPLPPIIVPPMMVRDFNFSAMVDAI